MAGNADVIEEFRANGGKVGGWLTGAPLMLLTTAGRRTGRRHTTPAVYLRDGTRYIVFATNAGAAQHPQWYRNILADQQVTVDVGADDGTVVSCATRAVVLEGRERDRFWELQCAAAPAFRAYQERTSRRIPVVALVPLHLGADQVQRAVGEQLLRHHADLRAQLARVRAALDGARPDAPDLAGQLRSHCLTFCYGLQMHHTRENGAFTEFERQFPHLGATIERLRTEHRAVERGLTELAALLEEEGARSPAEVRAEIERIATGLGAHFAREEEELLPALGVPRPAA